MFSADGRSAYFLGKRGKDERVSVFVSHDGGSTFAPRGLQPAIAAHATRRHDDDDEPAESDGRETIELDENAQLKPGDDGTIGLATALSRGSYAYVTSDDDGRVLQLAGPPLDEEGNPIDVVFAGYGRRVLAVPSYLGSDGTSGWIWESLDGGANWDKQAMPQALVREYSRNNVAVACTAAGCLFGDTIARVGWGGGADPGGASPPGDAAADVNHRVLSPIVCDLSPSAKWARIEDAVVAEHASSALPAVRELMRGRSVWSALSHDRATGALAVTTATMSEKGDGEARVVRRPLLGARGKSTATYVAGQADGYAAVRVPFAADAHGRPTAGSPLRNLELAWENLTEGVAGRARVADVGSLEQGDVASGAGGLNVLHPALVALRARGVFLRVHAAQTKAGQELFVDAAGRVDRHGVAPFPASSPLGSLDVRADAASVGGELLAVGLVQDEGHAWASILLAKRTPSGGWSTTADALLPQRSGGPLGAFTSWSSTPKTYGVTALVADPVRAHAWAHYIGFRADGSFLAAQPVATLNDLGPKPRPCSAADRATTPRAVMPLKANNTLLFQGVRHPVIVNEPKPKGSSPPAEPIVLLTSGAVVHGTPASPCLAAFQADGVQRTLVGAVIPGELARAWLFRVTSDAPPAGKRADSTATHTLEYRPMTCRYEAAAAVPEIVWSQEGTSRPWGASYSLRLVGGGR